MDTYIIINTILLVAVLAVMIFKDTGEGLETKVKVIASYIKEQSQDEEIDLTDIAKKLSKLGFKISEKEIELLLPLIKLALKELNLNAERVEN